MNCFNLEIEPIEQFCKYGCKRKVKHEYGSCFDCYKIDYQKKVHNSKYKDCECRKLILKKYQFCYSCLISKTKDLIKS
jgi:hypothetical protein